MFVSRMFSYEHSFPIVEVFRELSVNSQIFSVTSGPTSSTRCKTWNEEKNRH